MRLYRPHIPLEVRIIVAMRQLGDPFSLEQWWGNYRILLDGLLWKLSCKLDCQVEDLRLDHDPPLALRMKLHLYKGTIIYRPHANDPQYLIYRSHANHDIKTRVRGDGAQFSDLALIRREKKRNRPAKVKRPWPKRPFPKRRKA